MKCEVKYCNREASKDSPYCYICHIKMNNPDKYAAIYCKSCHKIIRIVKKVRAEQKSYYEGYCLECKSDLIDKKVSWIIYCNYKQTY
ncbi:MAG: hypothetical protein QHH13_13165 [Melioribacter sp.]|uniref:hypothetical protein n=1 Tax=Rosettibacter primus TaxID=3111523 RepID=UPI00247CFBD9|nr:hypothetical protein [Melioribacter sp.]